MSKLPFVVQLTIQDLLDHRIGLRKESLKIICFLAKSTLQEVLDRKKALFEHYRYSPTKLQDIEGYQLWKFSRPRPSALENFYALHTPENYVFLMSKMPSKAFKWRLIPFAKELYPDLVRVYASSEELRSFLALLQERLGRSLLYNSVVMKRLFGARDQFTDVYFGRLDRPFQDAFRTASSRGSWVDFIQVHDDRPEELIVSVSRGGLVSVRKGNFEQIADCILFPLMSKGGERYKFLSNRDRHTKPERQISPFFVRYDESLFDKPEVIVRLRDVIQSYRHCYYTVVHSGNPYLYMAVMDTLDNSAFSIRTLRDDALLVVPQVRATADSLTRFHRYLSEEFREGTLEEAKVL